MKIRETPIAEVIPYARNPRKNEAAVAKVAASIKEYGFRQPIVVDEENVIIAGHTRLLAAQQLGLSKVPVHVASGLSPQQVKAYRLADNRVAQESQWDNDLLKLEMADLGDFDLSLTGFDDDEIANLLNSPAEGLTDPDDIPENVETVSVPGDVWVLGKHRLVCGDCTDPLVVEKCLNGVEPHLMVTDPPYGVNYDASWRDKAGVGSKGAATGKVLNDDRADWSEAWSLFPGDVAYVWHGGLHAATVAESLRKSRFNIRSQIVWVKTRPALSRGNYHWQHEPVFYAVADDADDNWRFVPEHEVASYAVLNGKAAQWKGGRKQSTVWFIEHLKSDTGHSTQKPVECMKRPIENNSSPGQAVYEPFSGSGTTIIAAEMTGRVCHAIELNPEYVDIAVRRWEDFTGKKAVREDATEGAQAD